MYDALWVRVILNIKDVKEAKLHAKQIFILISYYNLKEFGFCVSE